MITGTIKLWKQERGFGFIVSDDGTDHFCHIRDCRCTVADLKPGTKVRFEAVVKAKGPAAVDVELA